MTGAKVSTVFEFYKFSELFFEFFAKKSFQVESAEYRMISCVICFLFYKKVIANDLISIKRRICKIIGTQTCRAVVINGRLQMKKEYFNKRAIRATAERIAQNKTDQCGINYCGVMHFLLNCNVYFRVINYIRAEKH